MKTKSILNSLMAVATAVFINNHSLSAWGPEDEDIAIIGSGSGAFSAAIHLANKGAKVTMIEEKTVGGTCVNVGCVPSKILIRAGHMAHLQHSHPFDGIQKNHPTVNPQMLFDQLQQRVSELRQVKYKDILLQNPNIKFVQGRAQIAGSNKVLIKTAGEETVEINPTKILIATGSYPSIPHIEGLKETPYWTSTEALFAGVLPKRLIVMGGSVVAVELAQAFSHLGSKVTMLARSTLLSKEDPEIGHELKGIFEKEGIRVLTHTIPKSVGFKDGSFQVNLGEETLFGDHLLVATGRHANTKDLGVEDVGLKLDTEGRIVVDDFLRTSAKNIYAVGDCTHLPPYVYVAAAAGSKAAINMLSEYTGEESRLDLSIVPAVTFTEPQVATVGLSVRQAEDLGYEIESRTLPLTNVPRALANFDTRGFIKLVVDKKTNRILGSQIVAEDAGNVIQTAALAIRSQMIAQELASQLFPYLTMGEGLKLCAQTFFIDVKKLSCCAHMEETKAIVPLKKHEGEIQRSGILCLLGSACAKVSQVMIDTVPTLPSFVARLFMSQYPTFPEEEQDVALGLFQLLTEGKPVDPNALAASTNQPPATIMGILKEWPDVYYDDNHHIVGYGGLTFKPTSHKIMFDERILYTWCAWDTLFLPAILDKSLTIESQSPVDNSLIRIEANPESVKSVEPKEAVISFMMPSRECIKSDIQKNFCHFIHFFPSRELGEQWIKVNPGTYLISIEEAFKIGQMKNQAQFGKKLQ